ncbi:MAG: hypothetical protein EOM26_09445 [Alphaproteobacteria bacterium]|nr:hypothetical protein [Alphaproteobacteria bacterium]
MTSTTTSPGDIRSRFDALRNRVSEPAVAAGRATDLDRGLLEATEQDNGLSAQFSLNESAIYRTLLDTSLDKSEMFDRISRMMLIDFEDTDSERHPLNEKFGQQTTEIRAIIKKLVADYNEHNRECIRLSRDNPLSELKKSLQDVMDNYRDVVRGRADLKGKVQNVETMIAELGGEKELVKAIVDAIDRQREAERLEGIVAERTRNVSGLDGEIRTLEYTQRRLTRSVNEGDSKLFLMGEARRQYREDKRELGAISDKIAAKRANLADAREGLTEATSTYRAYIGDDRHAIHEKVLAVLDIGGDGFKAKIHELAKATLDYVDDTETILTGIHDQLDVLRGRTVGTLDVNANIGDKVDVLRKALEFSTRRNTEALKDFKEGRAAGAEPTVAIEGLEELSSLSDRDQRKMEQAAHGYVADLDGVLLSTTTLADQLQNLNVSLLNLKDIVEQGLTRAETQQIIAITIATQSGQNMLDGAQALAALVQALVNEGQFQSDAEEAFDDSIRLMERSLLAKQSRVSSIERMAELTRNMSEALDASNEATLDISLEEKEQLERLAEAMDDLKDKADRKIGMQAEVIDAHGQRLADAAPASPEPGA